MRVRVSTHLDADPEEVWQLLKRPSTLVHVSRFALRFSGAAEFPAEWNEGTRLVTRYWLIGLLPMPWRHHLLVERVDEVTRQVQSRETGGPIRTWDHRIQLTAEGQGTRYVDEIDIDAGLFTWFVAAFATLFYRYRQARWRRLVRGIARRLDGVGPAAQSTGERRDTPHSAQPATGNRS